MNTRVADLDLGVPVIDPDATTKEGGVQWPLAVANMFGPLVRIAVGKVAAMGTTEENMAELLEFGKALETYVNGYDAPDTEESETPLRIYFETKAALTKVKEFFQVLGEEWGFTGAADNQVVNLSQLHRAMFFQIGAFKNWAQRYVRVATVKAEAQGLLNMCRNLEKQVNSDMERDVVPVLAAAGQLTAVPVVQPVVPTPDNTTGPSRMPVRPRGHGFFSGLLWVGSIAASAAAVAVAFVSLPVISFGVVGVVTTCVTAAYGCALGAEKIDAYDAKRMTEYQEKLAEYIKAVAKEQARAQVLKNIRRRRAALMARTRAEGREEGWLEERVRRPDTVEEA
ncbi:hypothetical protein KIPB_006078 [Kipferlia bialata]|uniref:Uncharacterized protein n=1 Tax=Kipferlia bialata TaxID=797122 RepID=A0A9K3CY47_9EUKA|nr:hypothetical protein KIPB_006078 [Kipferlia bialata]|eukprot:g6078.t1